MVPTEFLKNNLELSMVLSGFNNDVDDLPILSMLPGVFIASPFLNLGSEFL